MALPTPEEMEAKFLKVVEEDEQIKQFILTNKGKLTDFEVYGLKLKIPAVIPRKLRHEISKIRQKGDVEIEEAEQDSYYLLSLLCQGEPFNTTEFWEGVDNETGMAMDILAEVLTQGYKTEEKVKRFRGK